MKEKEVKTRFELSLSLSHTQTLYTPVYILLLTPDPTYDLLCIFLYVSRRSP